MKKTIHNISILAILVLSLSFGISKNIDAQQIGESGTGYPFAIWMEPNTDDFASIQQQAEAWFEGKDKDRGSGYKQWKRWEYINQNRLTSDGKITNFAARNWDAFMEIGGGAERTTNGNWFFLAASDYTNGPSGYNPGIGRVNCIAFHPTDVNTLWVGLPSGGLWKTTNNGGTWTALSDGLPSIGVSGIVVHPSTPSTLWILTGDGDAGDTRSIGVLKSTNSGTTWNSTGLSWDVTENKRGYKLMMDPANNNELWAVTDDGLYQTTNGGTTWTNVLSGSWRDLEFRPGTPNTMYLSGSNSFYLSTDGGANWTLITSGLPTGEDRVAIGVSPADADYVYLLCGPGGGGGGSGTYKGMYRSFDSGVNFGTKSTTPNILGGDSGGGGTGNQAWYDLAIAVSRTDVADMVTGGINTWRSTDFGASWTITSHWYIPDGLPYTHADIHALDINPLNNRLYCGSDGGIFYSDNFGTTWTDISSGLQPTQFYKIAGVPSTTSLIIGGTQDNGSNKYTGSSTYTHMYGADGMDCMIDYTNSNNMYFSTQSGGLRKSTDGGNTSTYIAPTSGSWVTPYMMHPTDPLTIYGGYSDVYKSTNGGSTWTNKGAAGNSALVHGVNNTSVIYAASGSTLYRSSNGGDSWTIISGGLPGYSITGVEVDHQDADQVWVTVSGYNAGEKVYKTNDAAAVTVVWTNISGTLPNTVVNCIKTDNDGPDDATYIGTDIGVFYRDASLGDWVPFSNWLPVVMVFDLEVNEASNVITAGTYGRGLWRSETYTTCEPIWTLGGTGASGYSYYQASDYITSSRTFNEGVGQEAIFKGANKVILTEGFKVTGGSKFKTILGPCGGGVPGFDSVDPIMGSYAGPMPELLEEQQ